MTWFPPPLRFTLPGLLLTAGLFVQVLSLRAHLEDAATDVEERMSTTARIVGTILSAEIEAAFRNERSMVARNLLMHAGADPDLHYATLFDENGSRIFSSDLRENPVSHGRAREIGGTLQQARDGPPAVSVDHSSRRVVATFPVKLPAGSGMPSSTSDAVLLMVYDTSRPYALARQRAIQNAVIVGLASLGAVLALYLMLRWLLLGRLRVLLRGASRIEKGDYDARVRLSGRDELASLDRSFNAMAQRVASRAEALRLQELELRTLLDNLDEAVLSLDGDGHIRHANPAAAGIFDRPLDVLLGTPLTELVDPKDAARVRSTLQQIASGSDERKADIAVSVPRSGLEAGQLEMTIVHPSQPTAAGAFIASAQDVTYRARIERRLRQSQKMEAIGNLAGGIAHDFNNLLSVMMMNASSLVSRNDLPSDAAELVQELRDATRHAAGLTRQLLVYARRDVTTSERTELCGAVDEMTGMLGRVLPDDVDLAFHRHHEPLWVNLNRTNLEQIVANLIINARDAITDGGRIEVATRPGSGPEPTAQLIVADDGHGMDEETLEHVFEPFFSTKQPGGEGGTGLGLSTVYELVKQHGGTIDVDSAQGGGTRFAITLPASASEATSPSPEQEPSSDTAATGTLLVVEDQTQVRKVIARTLERVGFEVVALASAEEALELFEHSGDRVSAVITDMGLPGMNGWALRNELIRRRPGLPILLASGYIDDPHIPEQIESQGVPVLHKPFTPEQLIEAVRGLMLEECE